MAKKRSESLEPALDSIPVLAKQRINERGCKRMSSIHTCQNSKRNPHHMVWERNLPGFEVYLYPGEIHPMGRFRLRNAAICQDQIITSLELALIFQSSLLDHLMRVRLALIIIALLMWRRAFADLSTSSRAHEALGIVTWQSRPGRAEREDLSDT